MDNKTKTIVIGVVVVVIAILLTVIVYVTTNDPPMAIPDVPFRLSGGAYVAGGEDASNYQIMGGEGESDDMFYAKPLGDGRFKLYENKFNQNLYVENRLSGHLRRQKGTFGATYQGGIFTFKLDSKGRVMSGASKLYEGGRYLTKNDKGIFVKQKTPGANTLRIV